MSFASRNKIFLNAPVDDGCACTIVATIFSQENLMISLIAALAGQDRVIDGNAMPVDHLTLV